ncbi:TPA: hypothetical protein ACH3X1_008274 [Trebouxia sp. C0004]
MSSGLGHTAFVGVIVICLFLVGACSAFCSLGLVAIACLQLLVVLLALLTFPRARRLCLACNSGAVGDEMHLVLECNALASLRSRYVSLFTGSTDTMRSFFAQPDHMGVFHYAVNCLDFMMI